MRNVLNLFTHPLRAWLFVLALGLGWVGPAIADVLQAPGSRVRLDLPDGFAPAKRFTGFEHTSGASVVILEAPGFAYAKMAPGLTASNLKTRGVVDVTAMNLKRGDTHVALEGRQQTPLGTFQKLILLVSTDAATALISANLPVPAGAKVSPLADGVRRAFASAEIAAKPAEIKLAFQISYVGPFKRVEGFVGAGAIFNMSGTLPRTKLKTASTSFIASQSYDRSVTRVDDALVERMVKSLGRGHSDLTFAKGEPVTIDGLNGQIHRISAVWTQSGEKIEMLHVVLFDPAGGYFRMVGTTPATDGARIMPEFRKMAESFKRAR
ncbi:MAG: hypothetical protein AAGC70_20865 [Pseudomonadota bacterium]